MIANYKCYNTVKWDLVLEKISKQSGKYPLVQVNFVCITKHELEIIQELKGKPTQRVAFTLLCLAKFYNGINSQNNNWVNSKINDIFNMAHVQISKNKKPLILNDLWNLGLIKYSIKVDNINTNVQFVDNESEVVLQIYDFRDLGYEYALYCGERFIRCKECNRLVRQNENNTIVYCKEHRGYQKIESKIITCIDCGKEVEVDAKANNRIRCNECQHKKQLEYQRNSMQKLRNK
jgi:DNA-directed RNA polymerase subunit RPC12/RpoP